MNLKNGLRDQETKKMSDLWPWQFSVFNQLLPSAGGTVWKPGFLWMRRVRSKGTLQKWYKFLIDKY